MPLPGIMVQQTHNKVKVTTHIFMLITLAFTPTLALTLTLPPTQRADYGEFHSSKTFTGSPLGLTLIGWAGEEGGPMGEWAGVHSIP